MFRYDTSYVCIPFRLSNNQHKDVLGIAPRVMIAAGMVLQEGVVSELDATVAPDALILTSAEKITDYSPVNLAVGGGDGVGSGEGAVAAAAASHERGKRGVGHRRDWEEMDGQGFRRWEGGFKGLTSLITQITPKARGMGTGG